MADTLPSGTGNRFDLETELKRDLKLPAATAIIIGGIIGSGIFGAPAGIAQMLGSPGLFMLVWVVGGVLAFSGALCYAELGAMMPRSGGLVVYLREVYPPIVAFLFGWMEIIIIDTAALAAIGVVCVSYMGYFIPAVSPDIVALPLGPLSISAQQVAIFIILAFLCTVNCVGVRFGGLLANVSTVAKVLALVGLAVLAAIIGGDWNHFTPLFPSEIDSGLISLFGAAMIGSLFAFHGWINTNYVAGEVENPRRTLPLAIVFGLGICTLVYLAVNWSYLYVLSIDEIAASPRVAADAAERLIGPAGGSFISLAVMISTFGTMNGILIYLPRISYSMAREGLFFRWFAHVHPTYATPTHSIIAMTVWGAVWTFLGSFQAIIDSFMFAVYLFFLLGILGLFRLRKKYPDAPRPFRTPGYPYTPLFFVVVSSWYIISIFIEKPMESLPGLVCLAAGVPVYWIWFRGQNEKRRTEN